MGLTFIQVLLFEVDVISRSTLKFINHMQSSFVTLTIAVSKIGVSKQYFFQINANLKLNLSISINEML